MEKNRAIAVASMRQNRHDQRAVAGKRTNFAEYALLPQVTAMHFPGKNVAFFISNQYHQSSCR